MLVLPALNPQRHLLQSEHLLKSTAAMDYPDIPDATALSTSAPDSSPLAAYNNFFNASKPDGYRSNATPSAYTNASVSLNPTVEPQQQNQASLPMSASTPSVGSAYSNIGGMMNTASFPTSDDLVAKLQLTNETVRKLQEARQTQNQAQSLSSSLKLGQAISSSSSPDQSIAAPGAGQSTELLQRILSEVSSLLCHQSPLLLTVVDFLSDRRSE